MKKGILTLFMCLLSFFSWAQEPQIIGGYLLDGEDSFEELDAAVVTDAKRKDKNLDGKGMRLPGRAMMIPESVGKEIGSIVKVKDTFLVKSICFTVDENRMEGCKASIRIYRITDDGNLNNIVTMPIYPEGQEKDDLPHCTAGKSGVRAWRVLHQFRPDRNF